ncbi:hypothetical protein SLS64_001361 [Diaporthe eres]
MAIHWALPLLQKILPDNVFAKVSDIACNPTVGIHSGLYPIIHGESGQLITGVPYENGLRVPRSKMRKLSAEGINVEYGKLLTNVVFPEDGVGVIAHFADGTVVHGSMIIGADGPRSKLREIAVGNAEDAATTKFQIFHTNMTVCYNDAEKALFVRKQYPTSYLALSEKSFHAFQSRDAAHPMPPYRGQGLNHCIRDVAYLLEGMQAWNNSEQTLQEAIQKFEGEMIARGQEEVTCSVENGYMLHDWSKVQQSPVFNRGFKPMDGHSTTNKVGNAINA